MNENENDYGIYFQVHQQFCDNSIYDVDYCRKTGKSAILLNLHNREDLFRLAKLADEGAEQCGH